jgi:hypothetical protein
VLSAVYPSVAIVTGFALEDTMLSSDATTAYDEIPNAKSTAPILAFLMFLLSVVFVSFCDFTFDEPENFCITFSP